MPLARPGGCLGLEGKAAPGRPDTSTSDSLRPSPQTAIKLHSELSSLKPTLPRPRHAFQNPCTCKPPQLRPVPTTHPQRQRRAYRGAQHRGAWLQPQPGPRLPSSGTHPGCTSTGGEWDLAGGAGRHGIQVDPPPSRSGWGQGPQSSLIFLLFWV